MATLKCECPRCTHIIHTERQQTTYLLFITSKALRISTSAVMQWKKKEKDANEENILQFSIISDCGSQATMRATNSFECWMLHMGTAPCYQQQLRQQQAKVKHNPRQTWPIVQTGGRWEYMLLWLGLSLVGSVSLARSGLALALVRSDSGLATTSIPCHKRSYLCASVENDPTAGSSMTLSHEHVALTFRIKHKHTNNNSNNINNNHNNNSGSLLCGFEIFKIKKNLLFIAMEKLSIF